MTLPYHSRLGYRLPRFEISAGAGSPSQKDLENSQKVLNSFLELEHSKLLIPPFCIINVFSELAALEAHKSGGVSGPIVQVVPVDEATVTLSGKPMDLLTVYSSCMHETTHMYQISHLEVMNKYVSAEVLIYTLNSLIKTASSGGAGGVKKGLSFGSIEFRKLITDIKEAFPYLPLKIDRDIMVLLESFPLLVQMRIMEFPEVDIFRTFIEDRFRSAINAGLMKVFKEDSTKSIYSEAMDLVYTLYEMLPKSYSTLLVYSNYLTGIGAKELIKMVQVLVRDERKIRVLAGVESEVDSSSSDPLALAFERDVFSYEDFIKHKESLLKVIDDALQICSSGRAFSRLNYLRQKIDAVKAPLELRYLASSFSQNVFSQRLAPNQPPTYYFHANGSSYNKDDVMLFTSFFADLVIAVNILKSLMDALENGRDVRNAIRSVIRCPLKRAPQMKCASSSECEHEKTWLEIV
ncbi:MAG: hypothetical protein JTT15_01495 [Candidatus Brockarchaeota archaeon]|nr:hypothetical protein [Candidatus Brockarchaeota archaeon]